jgi:hypothetical protein
VSILPSRNVGQWVIGTALGMYFTAETLARLASFWWPLALGGVWTYFLGAAFGWSLRRFAGVDPPTAFFSGMVGGASEMAIQGERHGATVETIAAVHTLRVMIVVLSVPFIDQGLGLHGSDAYGVRASGGPALGSGAAGGGHRGGRARAARARLAQRLDDRAAGHDGRTHGRRPAALGVAALGDRGRTGGDRRLAGHPVRTRLLFARPATAAGGGRVHGARSDRVGPVRLGLAC